MLAMVLAISFGLGLSKLGGEAAARRSLAALIGFQSFRLPLELVMHHAVETGVMPNQLSFTGYNFDIATGAAALVLGACSRAASPFPNGCSGPGTSGASIAWPRSS